MEKDVKKKLLKYSFSYSSVDYIDQLQKAWMCSDIWIRGKGNKKVALFIQSLQNRK